MAVGEWDERQLCPDGACVGVIGPDGTCKVCGRAALNWGDERKRGLIEPPDDDAEPDADGDDDEDHAGAGGLARSDDSDDSGDDEADDDGEADDDDDDDGEAAPAPAELPVGWTSRQLCSDGSCIGLIGADGRCKVCGRTAAGDLPAGPAEDRMPAPDPHAADAPDDDAANGNPATGTAIVSAAAGGPQVHCPDPACSGLIGSGGQCAQCGKMVAR
jgi:hypothetical protein